MESLGRSVGQERLDDLAAEIEFALRGRGADGREMITRATTTGGWAFGPPGHRFRPHSAGDRLLSRLRIESCATALAPLVDRGAGRVALSGSARGLLGTPANRLVQAVDVGGMRGDANLRTNHGRNESLGPQLTPEAPGFGALLQQGRQAGELCMGRVRRGSRGWPISQHVRSAVPSACHPLADRPFTDAEGLGDRALGPASLREAPSLQPSRFYPATG
jgi:hypothetical protein